jgi:hypothetical protein
VLVFALAVVRSGALSASWLAGEPGATIGDATRFELTKALTCAALAVVGSGPTALPLRSF